MAANERIVVLIDMDCFYVQVEQRRDPSIRGKPCAVVQYNKWKGGGIIAVSYEARAKGVSRNMRGDDAKEKCPDIVLCMVPTAHGKADLTRYRDAGAEVIQVLLQFGGIVERASIDEAYIDLTHVVDEKMKKDISFTENGPAPTDLEHTYVVGYPKVPNETSTKLEERSRGLEEFVQKSAKDRDAARLLIAASIVEEIRLAVYEQTTFRCSAGISHNKVLAKLVCGINKPNKQTVLSMDGIVDLFKQIKIGKIRNLGGKLGQQLSQDFGIEYIGQLSDIPLNTLLKSYGQKTGEWLHEICRGIDHEAVKERHVAQSVGCSKTFRGEEMLNTRTKVKHWIRCLSTELVERLVKDREMNNRVAHGLTAYVGFNKKKSVSRSCPINKYDVDDVSRHILLTLEQLNESKDRNSDAWYPGITILGMSAGKFKDNTVGQFKVKQGTNKSINSMDAFVSPIQSKDPEDVSESVQSHNFKTDQKQCEPILPVELVETNRTTSNSNEKFVPSHCLNAQRDENSRRAKILLDDKRSFFSLMKERGDKMTSPCKIESAFDDHSVNEIEKKKPDAERFISGQQTSEKNGKENKQETVAPVVIHVTEKNNRDQNKGTTNTSPTMYDMSEVDMDVFNSLPLYLQQEIKFSSQGRNSSMMNQTQDSPQNKRRKVATASNGQTSIAGFLNHHTPTFDIKQNSNKKSPSRKPVSKRKETKKKSKSITPFNSCDDPASAFPLGFFRARTQASAAIRNAVEKHALSSQKRKTEGGSSESNGKQCDVRKPVESRIPLIATRCTTESTDLGSVSSHGSLWSSILNEDFHYCDRCKTEVPVTKLPEHSECHALQDR